MVILLKTIYNSLKIPTDKEYIRNKIENSKIIFSVTLPTANLKNLGANTKL